MLGNYYWKWSVTVTLSFSHKEPIGCVKCEGAGREGSAVMQVIPARAELSDDDQWVDQHLCQSFPTLPLKS